MSIYTLIDGTSPEAKLPRSQALDLIPWSGLQMVPALT